MVLLFLGRSWLAWGHESGHVYGMFSIFGFVAVGSLLYIDNVKNNFQKII